MIGALLALWRIDRQDRAAIIAAVQFMEGQHMANGLQSVFDRFPAKGRGRGLR